MIKRTVDITSPARLSTRRGQLIVARRDEEEVSLPLEDLGALLLSHPTISITHGLIAACATGNSVVICCDEKLLPAGVFLPLTGHALSSKITRLQALASAPTKKRLWKMIVRRKIEEQARTLDIAHECGNELRPLISKVRSGDPGNVEAQAARHYWTLLFGRGFRRAVDSPGVNALLNYGYAVVRAATARAVVGAGLCPVFGIKHQSQYNHLALVDDLVEPLRPWVDEVVLQITRECGEEKPVISRDTKRPLLAMLHRPCTIRGLNTSLLVALHTYVAGIRDALCGERTDPEFLER